MESIYGILLTLHNWPRWGVLQAAVAALVSAWSGWLGKRDYTSTDRTLGMFFTIVLDIQLLLGIILYFVSPLIQGVLSDFGSAMSVPELRFFGLEHVFYMVIAVIAAHVGSAMAKRANEPQKKFMRSALWFTLAVVIILIAIPWSRPLFRI